MSSVTIVIPCYNQAQFLPEAIESALNQTIYCDVVVVDDGSTDNTKEVASYYPVTLVSQANSGLAAARNKGIWFSETEFVLPLDAGDKLDPECVEKLLQISDKADILVPAQQTFGDNNVFYPYLNKNFTFNGFYECNQVHCSCLYRREMWERLGGYDESMKLGYEDWEFWLRAAKAGYTFKVVSEPLFFYRKHGESLVNIAGANQKEIINYIRNKHNGKESQEVKQEVS